MEYTDSQEIIRSIGELKSDTSSALSALVAKVDGINRRLDVSNGRINDTEKAIQDLRIRESRFRIELSLLQEEQRNRDETARKYRVAMVERVLWLLASVTLVLTVRALGL